ncbi:MAG TPA: sensor domain-containing diguanylate cyclase [Smithella sp.]|nr:sensor domain-containing diguanylate cyclase [Smithella sp.]
MIKTNMQKHETRDLWVAIAIALSLGAYHLLFNIITFLQYISFHYYRWMSNLLFLWILSLLWIAYRRWRNAVYRQKKLRNILASINTEVIMVVDSRRRIQMVNEGISMFGYSMDEVLMRKTDLLYLDRRVDKSRPHEIRDSLNRVGFHIGQATGVKRDGETFPIEIMTALLKGSEGAVVVIRDITERKQIEEKIRQMAYHDSLTGLPNRKLFSDRLNIAISQAQRNQNKIGIAMLDLDRFKDVNDTLGHDIGDATLKATAERLHAALRKGDTIARFGGDEFVLILPELETIEDMIHVVEKIIDSFNKPFPVNSHQLVVTTSIGVAVYPDDGTDIDMLLRNADIAMYQAKQAGRARYQLYKKA